MASERYKLLTSDNEISQRDPQKLVKVLKAYGNADPQLCYDQGYPYIINGLLHYIEDEVIVFSILLKLMF